MNAHYYYYYYYYKVALLCPCVRGCECFGAWPGIMSFVSVVFRFYRCFQGFSWLVLIVLETGRKIAKKNVGWTGRDGALGVVFLDGAGR